jgi:hypothetical protein
VAEYRGVTNDGHYIIKPMQPLKVGALLYTPPPAPVQEPYGYWWIPDGSVSGLKPEMSPNTGPHPNFTVIPLYTAPLAAAPVPLTDEQINDIWSAKDNPQHRTTLSPWGLDRIRAIIKAALSTPPAAQQEPVADGLIRQYITALVANKPDEAANATKGMVDYVYTTPPTTTPVPEGWKLVPTEATDEMLDAAQQEVFGIYRLDALRAYDAMLAATPEKGQP